MADASAATVSPEDQLAWEAGQRPRAAATAALGGALAIGGIVVAGLSTRDQPSALLLDSLRTLEKPGPIGTQPTAHIADFEYTTTHFGTLFASILMLVLGLVGIGLALGFLGRATRARREKLARFALPAPVVGAVVAGAGILIVFMAQRAFHQDVLDGARTVDSVRERPSAEGVGYAVELLGLFVLALGVVLVSLNAMRAGLLTRTMGVLGMFSGGAIVLFGPSQPLLPLWTIFLAPLMLGRWMGGVPPAWVTGKEEPWPTGAQMRQERMKARGQTMAEPDPEPVEERAARVHPSSKKRKRKRRG